MLLLIAFAAYLDKLRDDGRAVLLAEFEKRLIFVVNHCGGPDVRTV